MKKGFYMGRHPVLINAVIIFLVAVLGIAIVFFSLNVFTRHGAWDTVPGVENMSYTEAIKILHDHGFRTDIRDSIYNEEIKPGFVVEQFPKSGSKVKPGRKIFLYINAVHPREILIDGDSYQSGSALEGFSLRQGLAKLEELGFKNIKVVTVPGTSDRIIRLIANGKTVRKMQKVPINAQITIEVYDGELRKIQDSLLDEEYLKYVMEEGDPYSDLEGGDDSGYGYGGGYSSGSSGSSSSTTTTTTTPEVHEPAPAPTPEPEPASEE